MIQSLMKMTTQAQNNKLLERTSDLYKSTMRVLELGLKRLTKQERALFQRSVFELAAETNKLLVCLKKNCDKAAKNPSLWLLSLRWAAFSMTVSSGCFLLLLADDHDEDVLMPFIRTIRQCVDLMMSVSLKTKTPLFNDKSAVDTLTRFKTELENSGVLLRTGCSKGLSAELLLLDRAKNELMKLVEASNERSQAFFVCSN